MGLDLALLPFDADREDLSFSHSVLGCERDGELFGLLEKLDKQAVPASFASYLSRDKNYEDAHYGVTLSTPYGDALKYTTAKNILDKLGHWRSEYPKNNAVIAYLKELPPETKIALYWS